MSDLSFNIVALDKASATFVRVASQMDKVADKLDRLDGKKAEVSVNVKTDESTKALDSFSTRFGLMAAGIVAASPLAGAAIVSGIGAGFIGVAALAQSSNKQVQDSWSGMWRNVVTISQNSSDQLVPQIVGSANAINASAQRLAPQLEQAFSYSGPAIVALTRGVTTFGENAMPGATAAARNSLPVFEGLATAAGTLGTAVGGAMQSASEHSREYGVVVSSTGAITGSVVTGVVSIVNDLGTAWAENASEINSAVDGVTTTISGLAEGVMPVLSFAMGSLADGVEVVTNVLGPVAPMLGTVGAAALNLWAGFKIISVARAGVFAFSTGVANLGARMETAGVKGAGLVASMRGVTVQSSAAATAVQAAGARAATGAAGFGLAAMKLAGPLGLALIAGTSLIGAFSDGQDMAKASTADLTASVDSLTSAFEASNGAMSKSVIDSLQTTPAYKTASDALTRFGVSQADLTSSIVTSSPAYEQLRTKLQGIIDANHGIADANWQGSEADKANILNEQGQAAKKALDALVGLAGAYGKGKSDASAFSASHQAVARTLVATPQFQDAAATSAKALGLSLDTVVTGFSNVVASGGAANSSVGAVASEFGTRALKINKAQVSIQNHFTSLDNSVTQAKSGVSDAARSYQQSLQSISDASHSAAMASRSLADAREGVATAQKSLSDAQRAEKAAEDGLHTARRQAIQDLKDLHAQLDDQVVSEDSARVRLFEAQQAAMGFGIGSGNAGTIANQDVTLTNVDQVKAAIDLLSAQNGLNAAVSSGAKLREQVQAADKAGVDGAENVASAQDALSRAHDQTASAAKGVIKAQEQVTDAAYNEQKAHQAVSDAQEQSARAGQNLARAKETLSDATAASSRALDINTKAGQDNLELMAQLWGAIDGQGGTAQSKYNGLVDATAKAFGLSREAAAGFVDQLTKINPDFKFGVTAVASVDANNLWNDVTSPARPTGRAMMFAAGGPISGPGGPRSDDVPIMASNGEFMQPTHIVDYYGTDTMEAIRQRKLPKDFAIRGYAAGGLVGANHGLADLGARYQSGVNALTVLGLKHPAGLPKYEPPPVIAASSYVGGAVPNLAGVRGSNRQIVMQIFAEQFGWGSPPLVAATDRLLGGESGYNNLAQNPTSTAFGMFQFLNATWGGYGIPKTSDPALQTVAGGRYIRKNYGDPINAYAKWASRSPHWYADGGPILATGSAGTRGPISSAPSKVYDNGGWLYPGDRGENRGTEPEAVLTKQEATAYVQQAKAAARGDSGSSARNVNVTYHHTFNLKVVNADNTEVNLRKQFKRLMDDAAFGII